MSSGFDEPDEFLVAQVNHPESYSASKKGDVITRKSIKEEG